MAFSAAPFLFSQVTHTWPPGGATASPYVLNLPNDMYVPSSKRYNMVWTDQFYGLPSGKTEFVAKNTVGTQKIFDYQADDFRAYNSDFLVTSYHLACGINPGHNDDCPDPKTNSGTGYIGVVAPAGYVSEWTDYFLPWLADHGITVGSSRYEKMFQHYDAQNASKRVWCQDPYWLMNMQNNDFRNYMSDIITEWMDGNTDEGWFADMSVETMVAPIYNPNQYDASPYNFDWFITPHSPYGTTINTLSDFSTWMNNVYLGYYQFLYPHLHTGTVDYLILPNVDQMVTSWYDPTWIDGNASGQTLDGAMMENFGSYTGSDMYLTLERGLRHLTSKGKILIAQFYADNSDERYRRTAMYMLIKNQNSFLNINPGTVNWYPEYEIDLGNQKPLAASLDAMRVAGSGSASVFRRDYQKGMVLCNTSTSAITYTLPAGTWSKVVTSGGGAVSTSGTIASQNITYTTVGTSVSVPASGAVILKKTAMIGMPDDAGIALRMTGNEENQIHIALDAYKDGQGEMTLYDITGKVIAVQHAEWMEGENSIGMNIQLPHGIYFLRMQGEESNVIRFVK